MKIPLMYVLIAYIAGIIALHILDFSISVFVVIFLFIFASVKQICSKKFSASLSLLILSFLAGNAAYYISYNDIFSDFNRWSQSYITVTGRMCEIPEYNPETGISKFIIDADIVEYKDEICAVNDKIQISAEGEFAYGLTVRVSGFLKEFDERSNSVGYDSRMQYKIKNISYKIFAEDGCMEIVRKNKFPSSLYDAFNMAKVSITNTINRYFTSDSAALLRIILFGDYHSMRGEFKQKMNTSGAMRFLRSAYLNILILTAVIEFISVRLVIPKKYSNIITAVFIVILMLFNHNHPSFIRNGVFFIVFMLYKRKYGYLYRPDAISAGVFIILLFKPLLLFSGGFVLSVSSCIMLCLFREHINKFLYRFIKNSYLRKSFSIWLICTFSLIPLYAYYYNSISAYTLIYSLIFPPLVYAALIIMPVVIILLTTVHTAPILYQVMIFILFVIRHIVDLVSSLPFNNITLSNPSLLLMITFFMIVYMLWLKAEKEDKTDMYMILRIFAAVFIIIMSADYCMQYGKMRVHFINVGQGDSAFIEVKGKENILIDGGGSAVYSDYKVGEAVVVPYIEAVTGRCIDTVIVSHYHKDHCDGIIDVLSVLDVNRIVMPDCGEDNEYRQKLEEAAYNAGCEVIYAKAGLNIDYPSGLKIKVLLPDDELLDASDLNDTSIAAQVSYGEFDALFMGDMSENGEKKLLYTDAEESEILFTGGMADEKKTLPAQRIDLLKVGHHGSATSTSEEFIKVLSPLISVVSVGKNNTYNLPSKEIMNRIEEYSELTLRTDNNGNIIVYVDKFGIKKVRLFRR